MPHHLLCPAHSRVFVPAVFTVRWSQTAFGSYRHVLNSTNVAFMEMQNICRYLSAGYQNNLGYVLRDDRIHTHTNMTNSSHIHLQEMVLDDYF